MNKKIISIGLALLFILISGCDTLQLDLGGEDHGAALQSGSVSIVSPPDGTHVSTNQVVDIKSNVSSGAPIFGVNFMVDDQQYYFTHLNHNMRSFTILQPWTPHDPGEYLIQTITEAENGTSSTSNHITIYVDISEEPPAEEEAVPEQQAPPEEECPQPIATTHSYANCRSGPGTGYDIVAGLKLDQSFPIVGRSTSGTWWQVEQVAGGTCWIWNDLVDICGDTADVQVVALQEMDQEVEEEEPTEEPSEEPPPVAPEYSACHDYPDFATCTSDPMGFGGCSWDTGQSQCMP